MVPATSPAHTDRFRIVDCVADWRGKIMRFVRRHFVQQGGAAAGTSGAIICGLVCIVLGLIAPAWGAQPNIVGNWKLVSLLFEELATGNKTNPLGEHPKGYLIYTPEGRMMALGVHEKRRAPKIDEDRIDLHKYMFAYSGRYTVEGEKVVHHVDVSWNESFTGTDQVRFVKLEGDILTIKTAPSKNPITGLENVVGVLVWVRER
jgi:hypothetical protein